MNKVIRWHEVHPGVRLEIVHGDITAEKVDTIVNAANRHLLHGGVAGIITDKGGEIIQHESNMWVRENGPVTHDMPAYTLAGRLPARYVIHAVGPVWGEGGEDEKLRSAIVSSVKLADDLGLKSISLPAISTGIFGFPGKRAANIFLKSLSSYLEEETTISISLIRLVLYDSATLRVFLDAFDAKWGEDIQS